MLPAAAARWIARTPSHDFTRHRSLPNSCSSHCTTTSRLPMVAWCSTVMPMLSRSPATTLARSSLDCTTAWRHFNWPCSAATWAHVSPRAFLASSGMLACSSSHLNRKTCLFHDALNTFYQWLSWRQVCDYDAKQRSMIGIDFFLIN